MKANYADLIADIVVENWVYLLNKIKLSED